MPRLSVTGMSPYCGDRGTEAQHLPSRPLAGRVGRVSEANADGVGGLHLLRTRGRPRPPTPPPPPPPPPPLASLAGGGEQRPKGGSPSPRRRSFLSIQHEIELLSRRRVD